VLSLKANGNNKTLKDEFVDITLNELASAYKYVSGLDAETKRYLINDGETFDDDKLFEFKLKWISLFSDFTVDELRLVPLTGNNLNDLSIDWLYDQCKAFLKQPETYIQLKEFDHKKKTYNIIESLKTISGAEMLFGKANFRQWMISSQLTNMIEKNKDQGGIPSLITLFALLYSDGKDSSEDVVERSKVFGEVNALYGWSAYFFFVELLERYKDYFRLSMTKNPPPPIQRVLAQQQLRRLLSKTTIGRLLRSKLPRREFSILQT